MSRDLRITILEFLSCYWKPFCLLYCAVLYFLDSVSFNVNVNVGTITTAFDSDSSAFLNSLYTTDVEPSMLTTVAEPTSQPICAAKREAPDEHDLEFTKTQTLALSLCTATYFANKLAEQERQWQSCADSEITNKREQERQRRMQARLVQRRILLLNERRRALIFMAHCVLRDDHSRRYYCSGFESVPGMLHGSMYLCSISIRVSIAAYGKIPHGTYHTWRADRAGVVTAVDTDVGPGNDTCTELVDMLLLRPPQAIA